MKFNYRTIDLTHTISSEIATWNQNSKEFNQKVDLDYQSTHSFKVCSLQMPAGIGTHIDAPAHMNKEGKTIDYLSLKELIKPVHVIDTSHYCSENYQVSFDEVKKYEITYGKIESESIILFNTGWHIKWNTPEQYRNNLKFPTIKKEVIEYLISYDISGIGIDTLSPDKPDGTFPIHTQLLSYNKIIIENINENITKVPKIGSYIGIFPLNIKNGTEAPARIVIFMQ